MDPSISHSRTTGIYLLIGPDRYRQRERLQTIVAGAGADVMDHDVVRAGEVSAAELADLTRGVAATSASRLIVVEEAQRLAREACEWLIAEAEQLAGRVCLVVVIDGELEAKSPLQALVPLAATERFPWLPPDAVTRWADAYVAARGKRIDADATRELAVAMGADLGRLAARLDQLAAWVGERSSMTRADVRELQTAGAPSGRPADGKGGFALVDAIARRDTAGALQLIDEQLDSGKDVLELLGLLVWQLQRWLTVAHTAGARGTAKEIGDLQAWQVDRIRRELAGRSVRELQDGLEAAWELDTAIKNGRAVPRIGLEQLVLRLCKTTRDVSRSPT